MDKNKVTRPKRLILELTDEDHIEIKRRAIIKGLTIRKWLIAAIQLMIDTEELDAKREKPLSS